MKSKKRYIYCNGIFLHTEKNQEEAERRVREYIRQDKYEIALGDKNPLPIYEIREAI